MAQFPFYAGLSRVLKVNYRLKVLTMAFLGTHVPLIALSIHYAFRRATDLSEMLWSIGVTLAATLAGTLVTLVVLNALLRPVVATSGALRAYRADRRLPNLPRGFTDEVGTLMEDAQSTLEALETAIVQLEDFDPATSVLNRKGFCAALDRIERPVSAVAVVRFSNYTSVAAGVEQATAIEVLRSIIATFRERLGGGTQIGRIGDADLALVLALDGEDESQLDDMAFALRTLLSTVARPVEASGIRMTPVLAAGLAIHRQGENAAATLDNAVTALATTTETVPVAAHTAVLRDRVRDRFLIEQDLRAAIANEEFELHFQPVMDIAAARPAGAEALIRWNSPTRGFVSPGAFIPVAEASGLIEPIGLWVLREACRQVALWDPDLRVAINLGARQFLDEDLAWHVEEAIRTAAIRPDQLEIELTESVAMADHDHTRRAFGQLRDMGVQIAIDDFGTGYASMSTLRKLPFNKLKIDREFVTNVHVTPGSQAICHAMVALGHGLGLKVLAEGTEMEEEVRHLAGLGCDLFQGYYFSRPVPASAVPATFESLRDRGFPGLMSAPTRDQRAGAVRGVG